MAYHKAKRLFAPIHVALGVDNIKQRDVTIVVRSDVAGHYENFDSDKLLNELEIVLDLKGGNVLKFYDNILIPHIRCIGFAYEEYACFLSEAIAENVELVFLPKVIKHIMLILFRALNYFQEKGIVHRDIQPENIAITPSGVLKVWNFFNAQHVGEKIADMAITNFRYQPLESYLFRGTVHPSYDIWSAIVIFGDLWLQRFAFPHPEKEKVVHRIFEMLGFPLKKQWKNFYEHRGAKIFSSYENFKGNTLRVLYGELYGKLTHNGWDLLEKCLRYNPKRRPSAANLLLHSYFTEPPEPIAYDLIVTIADMTNCRRKMERIRREIEQMQMEH